MLKTSLWQGGKWGTFAGNIVRGRVTWDGRRENKGGGRGDLTPPELCLVASENWRKEQEKKKACAPSLKDVSTCLFLFLW